MSVWSALQHREQGEFPICLILLFSNTMTIIVERMSLSPKVLFWNYLSSMMLFEDGVFRRWWSLGDEMSWMGIFIKGLHQWSPLSLNLTECHYEHNTCEREARPPLVTESPSTVFLDIPASNTVRGKLLLSLSLYYSVLAIWMGQKVVVKVYNTILIII